MIIELASAKIIKALVTLSYVGGGQYKLYWITRDEVEIVEVTRFYSDIFVAVVAYKDMCIDLSYA